MFMSRGSILPLALIMTLTILLAGIGLSTIVIEGVRRAKGTDQSVAAYYMSDAGIERQLYAVRKQNATLSSLSDLKATYPDGAGWKSTGYLEPAEAVQRLATLKTTAFAVLDLFDPDDVYKAPGVAKVTAWWASGSECGSTKAGLEIDYASVKTSGAGFVETDFKLARAETSPFTVSGLNPSLPYRLRLKAFNCLAKDVYLTLYDVFGAPVNFFGNIALGSEGTYGQATQKIVVTMPKQDILSGLFGGYVLFSECQVLKGGTGIPICP